MLLKAHFYALLARFCSRIGTFIQLANFNMELAWKNRAQSNSTVLATYEMGCQCSLNLQRCGPDVNDQWEFEVHLARRSDRSDNGTGAGSALKGRNVSRRPLKSSNLLRVFSFSFTTVVVDFTIRAPAFLNLSSALNFDSKDGSGAIWRQGKSR
ncbi:hypothetical protein QR680_000424 [Steinernema hermaphroditum]|uniref:Uncharacterized protein n=1 Tax=Steinernema hermaphroditum TaxID=289476 RepID=A0AA39GUJ9_9BILA|nr:hypothetical protein QR680_000424 [Steinernema hermaphroditum]